MFEKFLQDVSKIPGPEKVTINLADNPAINANLFRERMNSIGTMEERELYNIVKESYKSILHEIFQKHDKEYLDVFTTPRFITILTQVLNAVQLTNEERIYCNKLVYDYLTLKNNDPYVRDLLFILSKMVNKEKIYGLSSLGITENLATYLALARLSDTKEDINVKRLNFIISTQSPELMTAQTIVHIYEKLFDTVGILIETTMFDVYNDEEEWVTDDIMEVYSNVSLAILTILESLPSQFIRKVLKSYTDDFQMIRGGDSRLIRFSMRSLSADFSRTLDVIEQLESESVYVP